MQDWCAAAEQARGAIVLSLDEIPASIDWEAIPDGARGGFVPSMDV